MDYAIDCSVSDILDFDRVLKGNLSKIEKNQTEIESVQFRLSRQEYAVEQLAERSKSVICQDIRLAESILAENKSWLNSYTGSLEETIKKIPKQESIVKKCADFLKCCKQKLNSCVIPYNDGGNEAAYCEALNARALAQREVALAERELIQAQQELSRLKQEEIELRNDIAELKDKIGRLESLLSDMRHEISRIDDYVDNCRLKINHITEEFGNLKSQYLRLVNSINDYSEAAMDAVKIVVAIDKMLSSAAETDTENHKRIKIYSPKSLTVFSDCLNQVNERVGNNRNNLIDVCTRISYIMQDNVTKSAIAESGKVYGIIDDQISDFDEKEENFRLAARALLQYMQLPDRRI